MTSSVLSGRFIEGDENISFPATDLVRVMMKSLHSLGLRESVAALEKESGLAVQTREVEELQRALLAGDWVACLRLLQHVQFASDKAKDVAHRMILEEKYLELLESQQVDAAMHCLQSELRAQCEVTNSTVTPDTRPLHVLASFLVCPTPRDLREAAAWKGVQDGARIKLLDKVVDLISPAHMVKDGRLEHLVVQALQFQLENCDYHNPAVTTFSLLEDVRDADPSAILPQHCVQTLEDHEDEVWFIAFSHDGRFLASASQDQTIKIWEFHDDESDGGDDTLSVTLHTTFLGHEDAPHSVCWSSDNVHLLSASASPVILLWALGQAAPTHFHKHSAEITGLDWLPCGTKFVSGSLDRSVLLWSIDGQVLAKWTGCRVVDLAVNPANEQIICASAETRLNILQIERSDTQNPASALNGSATTNGGAQEEKDSDQPAQQSYCLRETADITTEKALVSLHLDRETGMMLINFDGGEIQLLNLETMSFLNVLRGQRQGWFVLHAALGGTNGCFTISGSEDSRIYIWHTYTGRLMTVLKGHAGTVSCVAWRPGGHEMFASASDDSTIKIWSSMQLATPTANERQNGVA